MNPDTLKEKYPDSEFFCFGDSEALCGELTALVISGKKTATCDALSFYSSGAEKMPKAGRIDIALTWDGTPAVALRTVSIEIKRFNEVDEAFALAEGENTDLQGWQEDHREYFQRNGGFDPEMELVCERFEVIDIYE